MPAHSRHMHRSEHAGWVMASFRDTSPSVRYFVDLAANHPREGSSTYELEQHGWTGLCIEPNPAYASLLRAQRNCTVMDVAIDSMAHNVSFEFSRGAMGGIVDQRFDNRPDAGVEKHPIQAVTLRRALRSAHAPHVVDYLSLDVEGAETAVLPSTFPWESFTFLTLTIERPPPDLNARLFRHGYLFARTIGIADVAYVHRRHPNAATVSANHSFVQVPAKCRSHEKPFVDRQRLHGVRCGSIFGCCAFPGFPQSTTPYMRAHDGASAD